VRFARLWTEALTRASTVAPSNSDELYRLVLGLSERLRRAVAEAEPTEAHAVGAALVEHRLIDPKHLEGTQRLIGTELPASIGLEAHGPQLAGIQVAVAAGYAKALGDLLRSEQEQLSVAVQRNAAETTELRFSEARFRAVFEGAAIGISIADGDRRMVEVNPSLCMMLGYTVEELRGRDVLDLVYPDDVPTAEQLYAEVLGGKLDRSRLENRLVCKDGTTVRVTATVSPVRDEDGQPAYALTGVHDVTDRYTLEERLRFQAEHDPLTGLPNRNLFFARLADLFVNAGPRGRLGLCYLDLDGFKRINDSLGHDVGDRLLIQVAKKLTACMTPLGHLVARMGGDEFAILMRDPPDTAAVTAVAEQVLNSLAAGVIIDGHLLTTSTSIGVVDRPTAGTDSAELMKIADVTLYWAKSAGRGQWVLFDPKRYEVEAARHALAAAMPAALERGEFFVEYQPIVSLGDSSLYGLEALVRWRHPGLGVLAPGAFIELAEESGLIVPLGRWVLDETCRQISVWLKQFPGLHLMMSVNLAARQAQDRSVVPDVVQALAAARIPSHVLQLELTESSIMDPAGEPLPALAKLATLGVGIAIDDFGTGYSNMAYLRTLPIQNLKLAGPFVEGLGSAESDPVNERIVDALVRLAHALTLTVTAEGIETPAQAAALARLGCDHGQGHLFARPMAADAVTAMLSRKRHQTA
jgi:diguanylate cyclase (GGDEF)-like protein/PAS domain S-box-containing protein